MEGELLPRVELEPPAPATASVVWLHGLGASGHDFEPVVPLLGLGAAHGVRFVFPHAPRIPLTASGGIRMPAWFDVVPGFAVVWVTLATVAFAPVPAAGWIGDSSAGAMRTASGRAHTAMMAGVATIAGSSFGAHGEGYLRVSYANSRANIETAMDRIGDWLARR